MLMMTSERKPKTIIKLLLIQMVLSTLLILFIATVKLQADDNRILFTVWAWGQYFWGANHPYSTHNPNQGYSVERQTLYSQLS